MYAKNKAFVTCCVLILAITIRAAFAWGFPTARAESSGAAISAGEQERGVGEGEDGGWKDGGIFEDLPRSKIPHTGISGTLQIVLVITLGVSIIFLIVVLRAIVKEVRSTDEEK